jgi:predicted MFS family arabinose efflux permease
MIMRARLSIYAICFNMLIYLVLSVSIAGAAAAFPGASGTAIQYLLTVPSLACIAGTFLVPLLSTQLSQRTLSIGAQAVSLLGAAVYLLYPVNLPVLYLAGFVLGLAYGVLATTFPLLVNIHIEEGKRGYVMGIASGMVQFGRLASLLIAGFLGDIRWNFVYFTYVLVVASLCVLIPCLPPDKPLPKPAGKGLSLSGLFANRGIWELALYNFLFGVIYFMTSTHISPYIEGYGFGTASTTGLVTSVTCGVAGVVACLFSKIYALTKKNTLSFIFIIVGAGYGAAGTLVSLPAILFGILCSTVAASIFTPYILVYAAEIASPEMAPAAVSVAVAFLSVGFFVSPAITNLAASTLGNGSPAAAYTCGAVASLMLAAVFAGLRRRQQSRR